MSSYKYEIVNTKPKPSLCNGCPNFAEPCVTTGNWEPKAHVTFLGESPSWTSIHAGSPLVGRNGILLHKLINSTVKEHYEEDFNCYYSTAYAAGAEGKPLRQVIDQCGKLWQTQWCNHYGQQIGQHVIVALGIIAAKSCGLSVKKITDVRGRVLDGVIGTKKVKVVPTFSLNHLGMQPGLTRIFQQDIKKALDLAYFNYVPKVKTIDELSANYVIPKTIEEVRAVCDLIINYYDPAKQANPWQWPISVDLETNTLMAYSPEAKVIMISFAWDDGKSTAIVLDHKDAPYDPAEAWKAVESVLTCPKPKSFHNGKFDLQFLQQKHGIKVNNVAWDTMLAEHWLDEDRKGTYGLKVIAPLYVEESIGYEEELHKALRYKEEVSSPDDYSEELPEGIAAEDDEAMEAPVQPTVVEHIDEVINWLPNTISAETLTEFKATIELWKQLHAEGRNKERTAQLRKLNKIAKGLNVKLPKVSITKKKAKQDLDFEGVALATLLPYAAVDADVTRQVHKKQLRKMHQENIEDARSVMSRLYIPGTFALGQLEYDGTKVDVGLLESYISQLTEIVATCEHKLYDLALQEFNILSNPELGAVMRSCGFKTLKVTTKDKNMSLTKEVLETYQQELSYAIYKSGDDLTIEHPYTDANRRLTDAGRLHFVETLLLYRAAYSMHVRFIKKILDLSKVDGKIHTSFHLAGTSTGRLSSSRVNLQNIPLYMCRITRPIKGQEEAYVVFKGFNVKAIFIPDNEDELFWNLDIKAAEIRVLCYESKDEALIKAVNSGADIHTIFLTKIKHPEFDADLAIPGFKEKYDFYIQLKNDGDPEIIRFRDAVKRTLFGTLYGAGSKKIAEQLGDESEEGVAFAEYIRKAIFTSFPTIKQYIDRTEKEVDQLGIVSSVFGRQRRFWLSVISSFLRSKAVREAVNFKIQSASSDLVLEMFCRIVEHIKDIEATVKLTVHDSVAGTIKKHRVKDMKVFFDKYVTEATKENCAWLPVDWLYDIEIGPNYGTKMSLKKYLEQEQAQQMAA